MGGPWRERSIWKGPASSVGTFLTGHGPQVSNAVPSPLSPAGRQPGGSVKPPRYGWRSRASM
jgi:hypothetical protein